MSYTNGLDDPSSVFQTKIYTGTGSSGAKAITGVGFQPDWLWIKNRTVAQEHWLADSIRGNTKFLESNSNNAESSDGATGLASFDSDGFTLGTGSDRTNDLNESMVAWNWKETADAGFDIVSYTGNGSNRNISHSLSAVPKMMIIKNLSATSGDRDWAVYHQALGNGSFCLLNTTDAKDDSSGFFNNTTPTSSVFTVGTNTRVNANSDTFIAYLFAEKKGYSKFGSYTGNGNDDGTFVYTGFKPAFVLQKCSSDTGSWHIHDNKRSINGTDKYLYADTNEAEVSTTRMDFLSNGFKLRSNHDVWNGSGRTYVYMAFAESPFVTSTAIPTTAR